MMDWKLATIKLYIRRNMMINVIIQTIFLTEPRADREQTEQCECRRIRPYRERTVTGAWPELWCESAHKFSSTLHISDIRIYKQSLREVCILRSPGIAASPISLLSMGGVCGRSLSAGKILFAGRQTCSLYLVLCLCADLSLPDIWPGLWLGSCVVWWQNSTSRACGLFCIQS